ncbi:hypothetical protein [Clostridium sp.]|uniref:hypothetical protein n=1 Tax=Clostridium sp. TaxID=1506 RepID=UPI001A38D6C3|nr:hypothetical protein [Clostridium sp.]MBK5242698.1 hypothetical protein [Clostridium sp.]
MSDSGENLYSTNVFLADRKLLDELMDIMNIMNINRLDFTPPISDHKILPPTPTIEITKSEKVNDRKKLF